ncbi:Regulator of chromosome condensation RCC1 [Trinorchestia longiramus]|nr:Regulator of chromosome condensation RCC1 [Trinorchestia longiramus]
MSVLCCGYNIRQLITPADYDLQCKPSLIQLHAQSVDESSGDDIDDIIFSREASFWLSGSAWKTSSPGFQESELQGVEKITSSSSGLATLSKGRRVHLWNNDKWQPLNICFPAQKHSEDTALNVSSLSPAVCDIAQRKRKFSESNNGSSNQPLSTCGQFSTLCDSKIGSKDLAETRCRHETEQFHCSSCKSFQAYNDFENRSSESVRKGAFSDLKILDKKILLLDEAGDVWQGNLTSAPQCSLEALLSRHCVAEVCVGAQHCVLRTAHDQVLTCGLGMRGELGVEGLKYRELPAAVPLLQGVAIRKVVAGAWHCLALGRLGEVFVWGWNVHGQLGLPCKTADDSNSLFGCDNSSQFRPCNCPCVISNAGISPERFEGDQGSRSIEDEVSDRVPHSLDDEVASAAERNSERTTHLGKDSNSVPSNDECLEDKDLIVNVQSTPVMLEAFGDQDVIDIAAGDQHSLLLLEDGRVWSCGWNKYGQCGVCWRRGNKKLLSPVPDLPSVCRVWAGFWCSAFLASKPAVV